MPGTCSTCGSALHSDLSRVMGRCGPCRWGEDAPDPVPAWRRHVPPEPRVAPPAEPPPPQPDKPAAGA